MVSVFAGHDYPQITQITQSENLATKRHKKHKMKWTPEGSFPLKPILG